MTVITILAVVDLLNQSVVIISSLWLGVAILLVCADRNFAITWLGNLAGRHFVEIGPPGNRPTELRFGFQLLGNRFVQQKVSLEKVEAVEWNAASDQKGLVNLWFKHDGPPRRWRKPDQMFYAVGPALRKKDSEILGLSFVKVLRSAGVPMVRGEGDACFVRSGNGEQAMTAPLGRDSAVTPAPTEM
jgi:hypothetical protein